MPGALILYAHDDSMRANLLFQPANKLPWTSPPPSFEHIHMSLKRTLSQREDDGVSTCSSAAAAPDFFAPDFFAPSSAKRFKCNSDSDLDSN